MSISHAMILAAGRGERMRPLSDNIPKPLLPVKGKSIIEYPIEQLSNLGIQHIYINTGRLGSLFPEKLGDGSRWGTSIHYSHEGDTPLETAGGILKVLDQLRGSPFVVINGDIWCDYPYAKLPADPKGLAHLVLVNNPAHNPEGDFALDNEHIHLQGEKRLTFSGIAVYRSELFDDLETGPQPLAPLLRHAIAQGLVTGEHHQGQWSDIGTPERLRELEQRLP